MAADHPELISDDPRCEASQAVSDLQTLTEAVEQHGTLISTGQAAKIIGCSVQQVAVYAKRGKFTRIAVLGGVMVPVDEVRAYKRLKEAGALPHAGRGHRRVPMSELVKAS